MNKLSKLAFVAATAVMAASASAAPVAASKQATNDNWVNGTAGIRVEERHGRTLLAQWLLDPGNGERQV